jgi:hypothetical protein
VNRIEEQIASRVAAKLTGQVWITQEKEAFYPYQMQTSHLQNTIRMIKDGRMARAGRTKCNGLTIQQWAQVFQEELDRRFEARK